MARVSYLLVAIALAASGCGTRLSHQDIVAAHQGPGGTNVLAAPGAAGGTVAPGTSVVPNSGVPGSAGTGVTGGAPGATPGAVGGGATTGGAQQGGGTVRPTKSPIILGSVGDYSGPPGASLAVGPKMLQIWARWMNDNGGLLGHPIQVIVVDDGTDPARYQAGLKDLVETRHVFAFVAQFAPFTVEAGNKYLEKVRVPVIGGDCAGSPWYASPMLFPQCTGFIQQLFGIANQGVVLAHKKRFGDLYCAEAPVCAAGDKTYWEGGLARAAGAEPVYRDQISIADPDYTAQCLRARAANVEIFTVIADVNTVGRVAASCDRQDYHPIYIQGSGTTNAELAHRPVMDGTLVQLNAFPPLVGNSPASAEYQSVVRRYAPSLEPAPYTTQGWTAAKLFQRAAEIAGEPLTRERVLEALWSMKGETLGGLAPPLTFIKNKPPPQSRCWFVMKMSKGQFVAPWGSRTFCRR